MGTGGEISALMVTCPVGGSNPTAPLQFSINVTVPFVTPALSQATRVLGA
jgi:hypothetical protein